MDTDGGPAVINVFAMILALVLVLVGMSDSAAIVSPPDTIASLHYASTIAAVIPAAGGAYTIKEFCEAHRISIAFYYVMKDAGWGPREMRAGTRVLISHEAAADWRRAREAAAAALNA